jgi:hypothetical protein
LSADSADCSGPFESNSMFDFNEASRRGFDATRLGRPPDDPE